MEVLAGEIMEITETSVVVENTRRFPDEDIKDITDEPVVTTTSEETETSSTPIPTTTYDTERPSMDISTQSEEPETTSTDFPTMLQETEKPSTVISKRPEEAKRQSTGVSTISESRMSLPTVVSATSPVVSAETVEKKTPPYVVHTGSGETKPLSFVVSTRALKETATSPAFVTAGSKESQAPSPTVPTNAEHATATTRLEGLTVGPSEVGAQEVDKCSTGSHDCSSNGRCISLEGSNVCVCNLGFDGDGRLCDGMFICLAQCVCKLGL